jgi:putative DNA primase/helicase
MSATATAIPKFQDIGEFLDLLARVKSAGTDKWTASCPVEGHKHGDTSRSLSIKLNGDKIILKCHAELGHTSEDVMLAIGRTSAHLFLNNGVRRREVCSYSYQDAAGREIYQVVRYEPKTFLYRRFDGRKWVWNTDGIAKIPYRLPAIMRGGAGELCLAEGEKDADTLTAAGFRASSSKYWCREWTENYITPEMDIVIFADRDEAGKKIANVAAGLLSGKVRSLKLVSLPGTAHDVSDYIAAGGTPDQLREQIAATPEWDGAMREPGDEPSGSFYGDAVPKAKSKADATETVIQTFSYGTRKKKHLVFSWPGYLPVGALVHWVGKSTEGKSPVLTDLAARISSGKDWPDGTPNTIGPRTVILMSAEDDPDDTVLPRLELAGANVHNVHGVTATVRKGMSETEKLFSLNDDLQKLQEKIAAFGDVGLVAIDPITNYLEGIRMNAEEEVRRLLMPLVTAARDGKFTSLTVGHLNRKEKGTDPLFRIMGAAAFHGVARFIYFFGPDPDDREDKHAHVMVQRRGVDAPSLRYKTYRQEMTWDGETSGVIGVTWCGTSSATAEDVVDPASESESSQEARAAKRLAAMIRQSPEQRVAVTEAQEALAQMGFDVKKNVNWSRVMRIAGADSKPFRPDRYYSVYLAAGASWFE